MNILWSLNHFLLRHSIIKSRIMLTKNGRAYSVYSLNTETSQFLTHALKTLNITGGVSNFSGKSLRSRFVMCWHMHETHIKVHFRDILQLYIL